MQLYAGRAGEQVVDRRSKPLCRCETERQSAGKRGANPGPAGALVKLSPSIATNPIHYIPKRSDANERSTISHWAHTLGFSATSAATLMITKLARSAPSPVFAMKFSTALLNTCSFRS